MVLFFKKSNLFTPSPLPAEPPVAFLFVSIFFQYSKEKEEARYFANRKKYKELFNGSVVWQYFIRREKVFGEI